MGERVQHLKSNTTMKPYDPFLNMAHPQLQLEYYTLVCRGKDQNFCARIIRYDSSVEAARRPIEVFAATSDLNAVRHRTRGFKSIKAGKSRGRTGI